MSYTPEALRRTPIAEWLAEGLEDPVDTHGYRLVANNAAAELRRLHAENERLKAHIVGQTNRLDCELIPMAESLEAQRDELLEALKVAMGHIKMSKLQISHCKDEAMIRAAIAKAEGSQT